MTSRKKAKPTRKEPQIADPATLLAAAEKAPRVFHIADYFRAIYLMRKKGYSWRELEKWVGEFGIKVSAVHLRRLYVEEDARLEALTAAELAAQGLPEDMIKEFLEREDPTKRLAAADPEDTALEAARRKLLTDAGAPDEIIESTDFSSPITVGDKTI